MPTVASHVRTLKVSESTPDDDPYVVLVAAIVARAWLDAQGDTFAPGPRSPATIQAEARAWWAEDAQVVALLDLANLPSAAVLRRVRQLHSPATERTCL